MKSLNIVAAVLALWVGVVQAANFTVSDIRIEGLQQVEPGIVFRNFPISRGNQVDDQRLNDATRDLFETGYFDDVQLLRDEGDVLVLRLVERPSVSLIRIEGNDLIKEEQLRDALKNGGVEEGDIFRRASLDQIRLELLKVYNAAGRYTATIDTEVEEVEGNRVALNIDIKEGKTAIVKQVNIIGNKNFTDDELLDLFDTGLTNMWSFWTDNDKYARERVSADIERLRSFYLDRGYIKFEINSTDVSISPDQKQVYININLTEGAPYTLSEIKLAGETGVADTALREAITAQPGDLYSRKSLTRIIDNMQKALGEAGYLGGKLNATPEFVSDYEVAITIFVEPGKVTYVRRIEIRGNSTTADEVIRREIPQMEGALAKADLIDRAKEKLDRMGYFSSINIKTQPVAGTDDQVDVLIDVQEQALGQFSAGIGFSDSAGALFDLGLQQDNFLGTGNSFGIAVSNSSVLQELSLNFTDPYYTLDGVSRGFDVYYRERDFQEDDVSNYNTNELGGSIAFGYPIDQFQRVSASLGLDTTEVALNSGVAIPSTISSFVSGSQEEYLTYQLNLGWRYNDLNSRFFPTKGRSQRVDLAIAVPGGDLSYYKATYDGRYYQPLNVDETWVLGFKTRAGYADTLDSNPYPFFKNFFAGGLSTVRGYGNNSLGPRDGVTDDIIGGDILLTGAVELIFPVPFLEDNSDLRTTAFIDAGNVYARECGTGLVNCSENIELGDLRMSAGVGLSWLTAIGPLSVSYAQALNEQSGDVTDAIQFALGRTF